MIRLIDVVTSKGEGICNEDRAGSSGNLAWVIDGATSLRNTPILPAPTDAAWLADFIDDYFRSKADSLVSLRIDRLFSELASTVKRTLEDLRFPADEIPPVCSCGVVVRDGTSIKMGMVGDVYLYELEDDRLLEDPLFGRREKSASSVSARDRSGRVVLSDSDREAMAKRRIQYIYGEVGSFVLSNNPDVGRGVRSTLITSADRRTVLLSTDGFARLVESYSIYPDWRSLAAVACAEGLAPLLQELREHESRGGNGEPRFKRRDDACAMLVSV